MLPRDYLKTMTDFLKDGCAVLRINSVRLKVRKRAVTI
jgi:hypothetical protein